MSKVDAMRAMREARYAATTKPAPANTSIPVPGVPEAGGRCGHRNIGGKSCTRPVGHPEKNHRYAAG